MWNLKIEIGYNEMYFKFRKLVDASAFIEAVKESVVLDDVGKQVFYKLTFVEREVKA